MRFKSMTSLFLKLMTINLPEVVLGLALNSLILVTMVPGNSAGSKSTLRNGQVSATRPARIVVRLCEVSQIPLTLAEHDAVPAAVQPGERDKVWEATPPVGR